MRVSRRTAVVFFEVSGGAAEEHCIRQMGVTLRRAALNDVGNECRAERRIRHHAQRLAGICRVVVVKNNRVAVHRCVFRRIAFVENLPVRLRIDAFRLIHMIAEHRHFDQSGNQAAGGRILFRPRNHCAGGAQRQRSREKQ